MNYSVNYIEKLEGYSEKDLEEYLFGMVEDENNPECWDELNVEFLIYDYVESCNDKPLIELEKNGATEEEIEELRCALLDYVEEYFKEVIEDQTRPLWDEPDWDSMPGGVDYDDDD